MNFTITDTIQVSVAVPNFFRGIITVLVLPARSAITCETYYFRDLDLVLHARLAISCESWYYLRDLLYITCDTWYYLRDLVLPATPA